MGSSKEQSMRVVRDIESSIAQNFRSLVGANCSVTPIHLMALTTSLAQACGNTRLILKSSSFSINSVALTVGAEEMVAACSDGKLRVYEMKVGTKTAELAGSVPLKDVRPAGRNRYVTIGENSSVAEVWCLQEGRVVMTLPGIREDITCFLVHPRGTTVLLGTVDGKVHMHSLVDGSCELVMNSAMEPVTSMEVAWNVSPAMDSPIVAVGHSTGGIAVWDLMGEPEDLPICKLRGHKARVSGVAFYNRGQNLISASHDGTVVVWDMLTGSREFALEGHRGPVNGVEVEPKREKLALTWSDDVSAIVWSLESHSKVVLRGDTSFIVSARFLHTDNAANGGSHLRQQVVTATGDGSASIWDSFTGELLQVLAGHSQAITNIVIDSSEQFIASVSEDKTVHLWDLHSRVVDMSLPHRCGINALQAFPNSEVLVSYGKSGSIQLWDCACMDLSDSGARDALTTVHPPLWTATSTNGRLLASCSSNSHAVVRDAATLSAIHEMPPRLGTHVRSAAFSGDCKLMAVVLQDSSITLWDLTRKEIMWQPQGRGMMAAANVHHVGVTTCFLSQKGDVLVTLSKDCTARVWNVILSQAGPVCVGHTSPLTCGWLSQDGELLLTGSEDCTVRVWDTSTGQPGIILAHDHSVTQVQGTLNKRRAFTCAKSGTAWLWDIEDGSCTAVLRLTDASISAGLFLQDARLVVTRHSTASIAVWHVGSGSMVAFFVCDEVVSHITCTPMGVLAVGTTTGAMHFLQLPLRTSSRSFNNLQRQSNAVQAGPKIVHATIPNGDKIRIGQAEAKGAW